MPRIPAEICRCVWAALEDGLTMSFDDIQMLSGIGAEDSAPYLSVLYEHGYAAISGIRRLRSGDSITLFRLIKHTGPKAPHINERGTFVDPNAANVPGRRYPGGPNSPRSWHRSG